MIAKLFLVALALTFICISAKPGASFYDEAPEQQFKRGCGPDNAGCSSHSAYCHTAEMKQYCPATCGQCKREYGEDLQIRAIMCPCWWKGCFWGQYPNDC
ncbi:hypothetical protein ACROYT_G016904 [Oculina patagonica]